MDIFPKFRNFPNKHQHLQPKEEAGVSSHVVLPPLYHQTILYWGALVHNQYDREHYYHVPIRLPLQEIRVLLDVQGYDLPAEVDEDRNE